jgi:hypothetical protein
VCDVAGLRLRAHIRTCEWDALFSSQFKRLRSAVSAFESHFAITNIAN